MKKFRVIAILLVVVMLLGACGQAQNSDNASAATTEAATAESTEDTTAANEEEATAASTEEADVAAIEAANDASEAAAGNYDDILQLLDDIVIPDGETIQIGYLGMDERIQYCADVTTALETTAAKFGDQVELSIFDGRGDPAMQVSQAEDMITKGVDAAVISVIDRDSCMPAINGMEAAGIPVIVLENPDITNCASNTGYDFVDVSVAQVDIIAEALGEKGVVNLIVGQPGNPSSEYGYAGVVEGLEKYPEMSLGASQPANWDRAQAMNITEDWITSGQEFDAIIALNDEMAISAALALQAAGITDVPVVGIDGQDETADLIREGVVYGSMYKNPELEGTASVTLAICAALGTEIAPRYYVNAVKVTPENVDTYKTESAN